MFELKGSGRRTTHRNVRLTLAVAASIALCVACTTTSTLTDEAEDAVAGIPGDVEHVIVAGDRLGDIALRYTGQAVRWQEIARYNQIEDPRTLRIGDVIVIPGSMLRENNQPPSLRGLPASTGTDGADAASATVSAASLALQRGREENSGSTDVTVAPVTTNRRFRLQPIDSADIDDQPGDRSAPPPQVRVVGTYYPKGIYQQPASYSRLMMRVAPGTIFELDSEVNDWFKVVTSQGVGYLRQIDGKIVPSAAR